MVEHFLDTEGVMRSNRIPPIIFQIEIKLSASFFVKGAHFSLFMVSVEIGHAYGDLFLFMEALCCDRFHAPCGRTALVLHAVESIGVR